MGRPKKTEICPVGGVGVGGKWMFWIWYHLLSGTKRFGQLRRLIPTASRQMLTVQLREMEQMGVLQRRVYAQRSPKVEYTLTELARRSEPMVRLFYAWASWSCEQGGLDFDDWLVRLGGRWTIWIWYHVMDGTKRFSELQRLLPEASRQVLAMELRELEHMGVFRRQVSAEGPRKVEYSLTEMGRRSAPMLRLMYAWGRWFCDEAGLEFDWPVHDEADADPLVATRELSWLAPAGEGHAES